MCFVRIDPSPPPQFPQFHTNPASIINPFVWLNLQRQQQHSELPYLLPFREWLLDLFIFLYRVGWDLGGVGGDRRGLASHAYQMGRWGFLGIMAPAGIFPSKPPSPNKALCFRESWYLYLNFDLNYFYPLYLFIKMEQQFSMHIF